MKKTAAIFFLFFLSISQLGHILLYCVQLRHCKNLAQAEILAGVQERFCDVIEENAGIRWEEAGEEFSMNGQWYDVIAIRKSHGKTLLYCLNDESESRLVKAFASLMASSSGHGTNDPAVPKFHITDQYIIFPAAVLAFLPAARHYHNGPSPSLLCTYAESFIPPPRC